jgi:hypothetical protein
MSNKPGRKLRRLAQSQEGEQIADAAVHQFISASFRRPPKWLPKFAWRLLLSLVIKSN